MAENKNKVFTKLPPKSKAPDQSTCIIGSMFNK
jgi:hypothetical protein